MTPRSITCDWTGIFTHFRSGRPLSLNHELDYLNYDMKKSLFFMVIFIFSRVWPLERVGSPGVCAWREMCLGEILVSQVPGPELLRRAFPVCCLFLFRSHFQFPSKVIGDPKQLHSESGTFVIPSSDLGSSPEPGIEGIGVLGLRIEG